MKTAVTVVCHIDLRHLGETWESISAKDDFDNIQKAIKNNGLQSSSIRTKSTALVVMHLPKDEKPFADIIYLCNKAHYPYKTLWLDADGQWQQGSVAELPEKI